jgi:hypothetical protein
LRKFGHDRCCVTGLGSDLREMDVVIWAHAEIGPNAMMHAMRGGHKPGRLAQAEPASQKPEMPLARAA